MATPTTLPSSFTAGQVLTALQMNNLRGAFRVLQVVSANQNAQTNNSTTTYADTGLSATITPSSTSSKILVLVSQAGVAKGGANAATCCDLKLMRGATDICVFGQAIGYTNTTADNYTGNHPCMFLDSPATTSATTYKTQFKNQQAAAAVTVQLGNSVSNIVLLEISA
jgi:hypothetical protein